MAIVLVYASTGVGREMYFRIHERNRGVVEVWNHNVMPGMRGRGAGFES